MKINWNKKYTTIAIYVIIVVFIGLMIFTGFKNGFFTSIWNSILSIILSLGSGIVLFYLIKPLFLFFDDKVFGFLAKKNKYILKRVFSTTITMLILLFLFGIVIVIAIPSVLSNVSHLSININKYTENLHETLQNLKIEFFQGLSLGIAPIISSYIEQFSAMLKSIIPELADMLFFTLSAATVFVFSIIFCGLYMARYENREAEIRFFCKSIFKEKTYSKLIYIVNQTGSTCGNFYRGSIFNGIILSVISYIIMVILGISYAPMLSIVIFLLSLIPIFGQIVAVITTSTIVFFINVESGFIYTPIITAILVLDFIFLYKKLCGNIKITSEWVLVGIMIMSGLLGLPGLIFGVPLFALLYTFIKDAINNKKTLKEEPVKDDNTIEQQPNNENSTIDSNENVDNTLDNPQNDSNESKEE